MPRARVLSPRGWRRKYVMMIADAASATGSNHRGSALDPTPTLTMIQIMTSADTRARPVKLRIQ
jgi:hypothetical protein